MAGKDKPSHEGERIAKIMARAGLCSRREAEAWISAGRVAVNGAAIVSPALNVGPGDRVSVDGKPLTGRERTRLFLYNKPRGLVTTHVDPQGRPTIFQALPPNLPRLISVGRLDLGTEGLLLLTNDGGLARVLELPSTGWLRRYRVRAHGTVTQDALNALRDGIAIDGIKYGPIEATLDRPQGSNVWLTFAIREGKNREVRNVLGALDLQVNRLIRVSFGPFQLGEVPEGGVEEVKTRVLREQLGERIVRLAGADFSAPLVERRSEAAPPRQAERTDPSASEPGPRHAREGKQARPQRQVRRPAAAAAKPGIGRGRHFDEAKPPVRKRGRRPPDERRQGAPPRGNKRH
jgi:23S rRNA pseudouridine2605 synthase